MNLTALNQEQQNAVTTIDGPLLVLAGAGSGKTKVLTTRIVYLIEEIGIDPTSILAITFTNKAAKEMKNRVVSMLGPSAFKIQISTFHSLGLLLLKENFTLLGYQSNFTILDSDDTLSVIKKIMKEIDIDTKEYNPRAIKNAISSAKNELMDASSYERIVNNDFTETVEAVYRRYEKKLKINNSVDFDDLLILPILLFRSHPEILKNYQERFRYILIDEYQDTNEAQYVLTKMMGAKYKNICAVGDESQSIYSFRGSNYRNILNFEKDYPTCKTILLEQNYRSTQTILNAANDIIKHNQERKDKNLWTQNESGIKIKYHRSYDEKDEAFYVVGEITKLIENGIKRSEVVILYRTNAQSRNMEEALLRENIPYKVVGSFYFYNRKEIKDLICYLKLIYNTRDDVSLLRVINVPKRGIGAKTIEQLVNQATVNGSNIFSSINSGKELSFKKIIEELILEKDACSLTELVDLVLDKSGIREELVKEGTIEAEVRLENLEEFKSITTNFEEKYGIISLEDFLNEVSLVADMEEHKDNNDAITLMTVHSAKGLEFDHVFIIGLEEGIFPHNNSLVEASQLEEERRLCYVAVTRARKELWLVNAKRRMLYGLDTSNSPSRFIGEIGDDYIESEHDIKDPIMKTDIRSMIDVDADYTIGDHVAHDQFGTGVVVGIEKRILTIAFQHPIGIKKLMKGHKSIRKV